MQDRPTPEHMLELIAGFLRSEVLPQVSGSLGFHVRVCANAVDLVRRDLELSPATDEAERISLSKILGMDGNLEDMNVEFCDRIARGELDLSNTEVKAHVQATTLAKLAVDQPNYASYVRAREEWGADD